MNIWEFSTRIITQIDKWLVKWYRIFKFWEELIIIQNELNRDMYKQFKTPVECDTTNNRDSILHRWVDEALCRYTWVSLSAGQRESSGIIKTRALPFLGLFAISVAMRWHGSQKCVEPQQNQHATLQQKRHLYSLRTEVSTEVINSEALTGDWFVTHIKSLPWVVHVFLLPKLEQPPQTSSAGL